MTIRVSGLFENTDTAERAVRRLEEIPIYRRRITRITRRLPGSDGTALSGYTPPLTTAAFLPSSAGQGFGQGVFLPVSMLSYRHTEQAEREDVQLEVWVEPLDAQETAYRFINAHGHQVRLY